MLRYRRCDLCLEMKRRPLYETHDQLFVLCLDCMAEQDIVPSNAYVRMREQ